MKKLLTFFALVLALYGGAAQAQSIARVEPASILASPRNQLSSYIEDTVTVTLRGVHLINSPVDTIRAVNLHMIACWYIFAGPPFYRTLGGGLLDIVNDSTIRVKVYPDIQVNTSSFDMRIITNRDTLWKDSALTIVHRYYTQSVNVTPTQAYPGQTLDVVVSNLRLGGQVSPTSWANDWNQVSSTLQIDFHQPWGTFVTNYSERQGWDQMVANVTVPPNTPAGCYDVIVRPSGTDCQVLNNAFCVSGGTPPANPARIRGSVYVDGDRNCVDNPGERGIRGEVLQALPGPYLAVTDSNGYYTMEVPYGSYTVSQRRNGGVNIPICAARNVTVDATNHSVNDVDFGDTVKIYRDVNIWTGFGRMRPGMEGWGYTSVHNSGDQAENVRMTIPIPRPLEFVSSTPPPTARLGDTLIYDVQVSPHNYVERTFKYKLPADPTLMDSIIRMCSTAEIPTGRDAVPENNIHCTASTVSNSYDPNDKTVEPGGKFYAGDSVFTYRIRFQNTGTDTAFVVVVRDTLSQHLDVGTIQVLSASHKHSFRIMGQNAAEWRFSNIMLLDSNRNEKASHGDVIFTIRPKAGLPLGTRIDNRAGIYFDFNLPVMTNTASTTLSTPVRIREQAGTNGVTVYPNPMGKGQSIIRVQGKADLKGAEFQLRDVTGKLVAKGRIANGSVALDRTSLKAGLYSFRITQKGKPASTGKLVLE